VSTPYEGVPSLTEEQRAVVEQPADAATLVTAGAGAGKTHTLVRRLDALVEREELSAGEILVLSFSRAAVRELKDRLARHGDAARHVRVQTFDSWALELLLEVDANGGWQARDFDDRIEAAADLIGTEGVNELYQDLRHVVIDEVQDLVGARRDLVETLLDTYDCGFTVVGDPAQAIYGFQVTDPVERAGETNRFFDWLRVRFEDELVELHLTENFRAETEEARRALPFGPRLHAGAETRDTSGGALYGELRATLLDTLRIGDLGDQFVCASLREYEGTTAILCRTNGQALLVSERLHAGGVPHRLQRSARDRVAPAWIGLLFRTADGSIMTRARFDELLPVLAIPEGAEPDELWKSLLKVVNRRGRSLDLGRLRAVIAEGRLPDELTAQPPAHLVVSSVHRAKGLEFDRVLVVDPGPLRDDRHTPAERAEEARMLYVALTRSRQELMHLESPSIVPLYLRLIPGQRRWGRYHLGKRPWRLGLELIAGDVHTEQPPGDHIQVSGADPFPDTAMALQNYLIDKVRPGDEIVLERLDDEPIVAYQSPRYRLLHGDLKCPIGLTSESFGRGLYAYMQWSKRHVPNSWPRTITGVRIDGVETVAGSTSAGSMAGLGEHGVWLVPRLVGLSRFTYDKTTNGGEDDGV
jgi:hypothetical protein